MTGEVLAALQQCLAAGTPHVAVTLVGVRGSAPQEVGTKLVATAEGLLAGTVGGGKLEAYALLQAREILAGSAEEACRLVTINLQRDLGMTCGGEVTLLLEHTDPHAWTVAVFGAGHVAQALIAVLTTLECRVLIVDSRTEWIGRVARSPNVRAERVEDLPAFVERLRPGTAVVVMTQGHTTDLPVLDRVLRWGRASYVGVLGSAVKAARLRRELEGLGHSAGAVAAVRCPIGLRLGKSTPAEIAISVAAELLLTRDAGPVAAPG